MLSLDDCTRAELKALARYSTPAQIAGARARIAREAADAANRERLHFARESRIAARACRDAIADAELFARLFEASRLALQISRDAQRRWARLETIAGRREREYARALRQEKPR